MSTPPPWFTAVQRLEELHRAAEAAAVLRAADRSGLLVRLAEPADPDALAAEFGLAPTRVTAALGVLEACGVVLQADGGWVLDPAWAPIVLDRTPARFGATLGLGQVRVRQFEAALAGGAAYAELDPDDRLTVAQGISPNPAVDLTVQMVTDFRSMDGVTEALTAGGRLLELGCGIASRLCAVLRGYPRATAVGIELDPDLAAHGRLQAERVGVADRLTCVVGDATTYEPDRPFDLVNWSQFFFPGPTRAGALATAHRALKPGGWLTLPSIWTGDELVPGSREHRDLAANRLLLELWQVPVRSPGELLDEVTAAGFADVHVDRSTPIALVRGRRN